MKKVKSKKTLSKSENLKRKKRTNKSIKKKSDKVEKKGLSKKSTEVKKKDKPIEKGMNQQKGKNQQTGKEVNIKNRKKIGLKNKLSQKMKKYTEKGFTKLNPILWILLFNLLLRLILVASTTDKYFRNKQQTVKHINETFGIAVVAVSLVLYLQFIARFDKEGKVKQGFIITLFFIVTSYDWLHLMFKLVEPKTFNKKSQLTGVYIGIIVSVFAFFAILLFILSETQEFDLFKGHYQIFDKSIPDKVQYPGLLIGIIAFLLIFLLSVVGFMLVNPKAKQKATYGTNKKQYYMDSFKIYYVVLITMFMMVTFFMEPLSRTVFMDKFLQSLTKYMVK